MAPPPPSTSIPTPKMSFSISTARKAPAPPAKTPAKRSHALMSDDNTNTDPPESTAHTSTITSFGSAQEPTKQVERVIPCVRDPNHWYQGKSRWKEGSSYQRDEQGEKGESTIDMKKFGLIVPNRARRRESPVHTREQNPPQKSASPVHTAEQEAMDALTGATTAQRTIRPSSSQAAESEALSRDLSAAAPANTAAQYAATPVEGYGAALLRGMLPASTSLEQLQKDWEAKAPKSLLKREKNDNTLKGYRLGLGAKASGLGIEKVDLRVGKNKGGEEGNEIVAGPLKRRNRVTGEEMTEDEFKERLRVQNDEERLGRMEIEDEGDGGKRKRIEGGHSERKRRDDRRSPERERERYRERRHHREEEHDSDRRHRRHRSRSRSKERDRHHGSRRRERSRDENRRRR